MDFASVVGVVVAVIALGAGYEMQASQISGLSVLGALITVCGGTLGALFLSFTTKDIGKAFGILPLPFLKVDTNLKSTVEEIVKLAMIARKEGVLAIEGGRANLRSGLFRKFVKYVIDGFEMNTLQEIIETEIRKSTADESSAIHVYERGARFAVAFGLLGLSIGVIHSLALYQQGGQIGAGLHSGIISIILGLCLSQLFFLPWSVKLKRKIAQRAVEKEVVKIGTLGILEGLNPHFLQEKLQVISGVQIKKQV